MKGVDLPPLDALIESGKVLALNMPAGTNPALARAVGIMLKNAWLQSLLRRPAMIKSEPGRYVPRSPSTWCSRRSRGARCVGRGGLRSTQRATCYAG